MAVVIGTNAGFVTTAPTSDPDGSTGLTADNAAEGVKDTTPSNINTITEIGFYINNATQEANFEVGIYAHDSGDDSPGAVIGTLSQTNAKGTDAGWKVVTGLNIPIDAETIYWIGVQMDDTATTTTYDRTDSNKRSSRIAGATTLSNPWATSTETTNGPVAIYALVENMVDRIGEGPYVY